MKSRTILVLSVLGCAVGANAAPPAAVPDLIWYKFDEAAGTGTTHNFAVPGVGFADAPVNGHTLGGGVLTGIGGGSATNFVDTGWDGATGAGSFSVYFELQNATAPDTVLNYMFGNASVGQRAFDDGVAGDTGIAFRFGGSTYATAFGAATAGEFHEIAFVYDAGTGNGYAYVDGNLVDTQLVGAINVTAGLFKVAGYSSNTFTGLTAGSTINDFRVYGRALDGSELPAPGTLTALLIPALVAGRRRRN